MIDAEKNLRDALATGFPDARVATEVPADLADVLPCIVVRLAFGRDGAYWTMPRVTLDVDYFAANRPDSRDGALAVDDWLHSNIYGMEFDDGSFGLIQTNVHPNRTPWANPNVSRFTGSYTIQTHSI